MASYLALLPRRLPEPTPQVAGEFSSLWYISDLRERERLLVITKAATIRGYKSSHRASSSCLPHAATYRKPIAIKLPLVAEGQSAVTYIIDKDTWLPVRRLKG